MSKFTQEQHSAVVNEVLKAAGVETGTICSRQILMVERLGKRNITNWKEVVQLTREKLDQHHIVDTSFEDKDVQEQLELVSKSIGLISNHGMAQAWINFIIPGGVKIELCPWSYKKQLCPEMYDPMATLRGLSSHTWRNKHRSVSV